MEQPVRANVPTHLVPPRLNQDTTAKKLAPTAEKNAKYIGENMVSIRAHIRAMNLNHTQHQQANIVKLPT